MKKYFSIPLLIITCVLLTGASSLPFIDSLKRNLDDYNKSFPQEKIYVQTDKTYYKPSESIWYKVFLVEANRHKASTTSSVVHLDLIDPKGNIQDTHELLMSEDEGYGRFQLNSDVPGGLYKLRARTVWQQNFGEETFFTKEITVQKVITPRLLLKVDFEKRAYGLGDEVTANLKVTDLKNNKTERSVVKSTLRIGGMPVLVVENVVTAGEVAITFNLPDDLNTADGILQMVVTDKGVEESITRSVPIVLNKISLRFFPEGGDLAEGIPNKVAFEALNEFGKGADVSGHIVDEEKNIVASFESFHLGMGAFRLTPEAGKTYFAEIIRPQGNNDLIALPVARKNSWQLSLKQKQNDTLIWSVYAPEEQKITLIGQTQGEIYYGKELFLQTGYNEIVVLTENFPAGVAVFTLFDRSDQERCERLVFLNEHKGLKIEIKSKDSYTPGSYANITIKTTDDSGKPVSASLGVAVVDEQLLTMADDKQDNMLSYLFFSSELKGEIQEPYFYFDKTEPKAKEAIDYLLLTRGWRRFTWQDVMKPGRPQLEFEPEKIGSIYGYVLDEKGNPAQADVYIFVIQSNKVSKVTTTREGHFVFHGVTAKGDVIITTRLPNQVYVFKEKPQIKKSGFEKVLESPGEVDREDVAVLAELNDKATEEESEIQVEYIEDEDGFSAELQEVVTVGYGVQKKNSVVGSVQVISQNALSSLLAGQAAGVVVENDNLNPDADKTITIRGVSSISTGPAASPLVLIDGVEGNLSMLTSEDVENIYILKDASPSIYGSRAANGVVVINTKKSMKGGLSYWSKPKYGYIRASSSNNREFYQPYNFNIYSENRDKENSTVFWNGNVKTDANGTANIGFYHNMQSSSWRITVEGISLSTGLVGSEIKNIHTTKPLTVDAKVPLFAGIGDLLEIPVIVRNNTDRQQLVKVVLDLSSTIPGKTDQVRFVGSDNHVSRQTEIVVPANEAKTVFIPAKVLLPGQNKLNIRVDASGYGDNISKTFITRQVSFPYQYGFSGKDAGQIQNFVLPDYDKGSLKAEVVCYTSVTDELFDGVESIFREPYGCFEQASSSTFPNIFALQLLEASGKDSPEIRRKAISYLEMGYSKLKSFEVSGGGFEWFGKDPAHTGLTAYGVIEFYEMDKVYNKVDKNMTERARDFILKRKDGKGGFQNNTQGYDNFSGSPQTISDAYIVYALTETEETDEVTKEYNHVLNEALKSKDMYRMALVANAAFNMDDVENYQKMIGQFRDFVKSSQEFSEMKIETTIVRSQGNAKYREAVALWILALLKDKNNVDEFLLEKCLQFINSGRLNGSFGNTQATSLCLQAQTKYVEWKGTNHYTENEQFCILVNNEESCMSMRDSKVKIDFTDKLIVGNNVLNIKYKDVKEPAAYAVNISWNTSVPNSSDLCPLHLSTTLSQNTLKVNETVRLEVRLENKDNEGKPMSVAIVGIPGGMSLQPWQLKELQEKEVYDYYEIIDDNLVIYYRELGPKEIKTINLDLKAEIPGKYKGMASSAYLYYMNEHKCWVDGISVEIGR